MPVDWKLLGADLLSSRESHGLGVRAFGKVIGISPSTLSRVENGHEATVEVFLKVVAFLAHPIKNKYVKP